MAARSVAVWYKEATSPAQGQGAALSVPSAELHFNLWRFPDVDPEYSFLDLGISLENWKDVESVFIFMPKGNGKLRITDLGPKLAVSETVRGIFNEPLAVRSGTHASYIELQNEDLTSYARVYKFSEPISVPMLINVGAINPSHEYGVSSRPDGLVLEIKRSVFDTLGHGAYTGAIYFRLRFRFDEASPFITLKRPTDKFLQSGSEDTDFIDFRLNEARNIPAVITQQMTSTGCQPVPIRTLHYLLVADLEADIITGNQSSHKSRILERELWADYLDLSSMSQDMIIYHWKKDIPKDFSNFTKLRLRRSDRKTIFVFLFWIMVASVIANGVSALLGKFLGWLGVWVVAGLLAIQEWGLEWLAGMIKK